MNEQLLVKLRETMQSLGQHGLAEMAGYVQQAIQVIEAIPKAPEVKSTWDGNRLLPLE